MSMTEIWKSVPESACEISNLGRLRDAASKTVKPDQKTTVTRLNPAGKRQSTPIPNIVAELFIGESGGRLMFYINNNKIDFRADNLAWVSKGALKTLRLPIIRIRNSSDWGVYINAIEATRAIVDTAGPRFSSTLSQIGDARDVGSAFGYEWKTWDGAIAKHQILNVYIADSGQVIEDNKPLAHENGQVKIGKFSYNVAELVADCYLPPRPALAQLVHINGNKNNNRCNNLKWVLPPTEKATGSPVVITPPDSEKPAKLAKQAEPGGWISLPKLKCEINIDERRVRQYCFDDPEPDEIKPRLHAGYVMFPLNVERDGHYAVIYFKFDSLVIISELPEMPPGPALPPETVVAQLMGESWVRLHRRIEDAAAWVTCQSLDSSGSESVVKVLERAIADKSEVFGYRWEYQPDVTGNAVRYMPTTSGFYRCPDIVINPMLNFDDIVEPYSKKGQLLDRVDSTAQISAHSGGLE